MIFVKQSGITQIYIGKSCMSFISCIVDQFSWLLKTNRQTNKNKNENYIPVWSVKKSKRNGVFWFNIILIDTFPFMETYEYLVYVCEIGPMYYIYIFDSWIIRWQWWCWTAMIDTLRILQDISYPNDVHDRSVILNTNGMTGVYNNKKCQLTH